MRNLTKFATSALLAGAVLGSSSAIAAPRTAFVHLFEWKWEDVAQECETFLGPKGFAAVQVSPPTKSHNSAAWWSRYQPVSYSFEGRSGNRSQFQNMVQRCKAVGVDIYVDAVINHMAAYDRNFPEVPFGPNDFNNCTGNIDYSNRWQTQNCDLVGLNDLKTGSDYVRQKIADYMNDATSMGVAGFRIDAAKHIPAGDLAAIKDKLNGNPYLFQEVIGAPGEPVRPTEYTYIGDVTEFEFARKLGPAFRNSNIAWLKDLDSQMELSSADAVTFVTNHDEERHNPNGPIWHGTQGNGYFLANIFALAYPYGYPKIMSGYYFNGDFDAAPPSSGIYSGNACGYDGGNWVCEHKWRGIANMVAFRNHTASESRISNWWQGGNDQIAFGRGGLGFVVINKRFGSYLNQSFDTGMPDGKYCNVIEADFDETSGQCIAANDANGSSIITVSGGQANFDVAGDHAAAIHIGARVGEVCVGDGCPCTDCNTDPKPEFAVTSTSICTSEKLSTLYYWGALPANVLANETWPGSEMQKNGDFYCHDLGVQLTRINVIFSNSGQNKTPDLSTSGSGCYNNGSWSTLEDCGFEVNATQPDNGGDEVWYFRGTANGWDKAQLDYDSASGLYYTEQRFNGEESPARFKIDNGNWTESYPTADYQVSDNTTYRINFDSDSKAITVNVQ